MCLESADKKIRILKANAKIGYKVYIKDCASPDGPVYKTLYMRRRHIFNRTYTASGNPLTAIRLTARSLQYGISIKNENDRHFDTQAYTSGFHIWRQKQTAVNEVLLIKFAGSSLNLVVCRVKYWGWTTKGLNATNTGVNHRCDVAQYMELIKEVK